MTVSARRADCDAIHAEPSTGEATDSVTLLTDLIVAPVLLAEAIGAANLACSQVLVEGDRTFPPHPLKSYYQLDVPNSLETLFA